MFPELSDKLQGIFKDLRGHGVISESNVDAALRQVRMALLEADVDFQVAREFIARVKQKALGESVLRSITPGQQVIKIFHDELTVLLGGNAEPLRLEDKTRILIVGLNGSGKTTSAAKLALLLKKQGRMPSLVACDLQRPAAIEQLATLGKQIDVPVHVPNPGERNVQRVAAAAVEQFEGRSSSDASDDVVQPASFSGTRPSVHIFDTAGRQEIDATLMNELKALKEFLQPDEVLLVVDAATGQQAVSVASGFDAALSITGIILTKLDGDARGGAALSMREVTHRPIKFAGTGEKLDQFELFIPERLAGRILGMGDVVTLVEKAAEAVELEDAVRLERKLRTASFDFNDFLAQFKMMRRMGPLENILGMLPGMSNMQGLSVDEKQLKRTEAIVLSMTKEERTRPDILNARRRQRIARGSGSTVTEVNDLLRRFDQMRKLMKNAGKMKKMMAQMARMKS
ncbi:MAG TPA: signal recognition particle protein [Candidatus Udaeobacter sp.]|jgi:signal recognition particle subunit SRP54|nr:signal recognition particle protein [Candidatus Udaeobacter sp.]